MRDIILSTSGRHFFVRVTLILAISAGNLWAQPAGQAAVTARVDSFSWAVQDLQSRLQSLEMELNTLRAGNESCPVPVDESMQAGREGMVYLPSKNTSELVLDLSSAQTPDLLKESQLQISGYLDAVYAANPRHGAENHAGLHQVDIDLARQMNPRTSIAMTIYYENEISIPAATINYSPVLAESKENDPAPFLSGWKISAGRFDIPFGLDYQVYTSIARETVTMPDVVAATHGGWNDAGLLNSLTTSIGTLDLFAVKGFESRVWNSENPVPVDVTDDNENWAVSSPSFSGGARLNFTVIPGLEYGASLARSWQDGKTAHSIGGVHARLTSSVFSLKTEGLYLRKGESVKPEYVRGFYTETKEDLGKVYLIQRFNFTDLQNDKTMRYVCAGAGLNLNENLVCRAEYQIETRSANPKLYLQVAAGF